MDNVQCNSRKTEIITFNHENENYQVNQLKRMYFMERGERREGGHDSH